VLSYKKNVIKKKDTALYMFARNYWTNWNVISKKIFFDREKKKEKDQNLLIDIIH